MRHKSQLAAEIARATKGAAELLGIDQSKVSRITLGQFRGISEAKQTELEMNPGRRREDRRRPRASPRR